MRPISSEEFFALREGLNRGCEEVMRGKNPVYTIGSTNYVQNFQSIAERLGVDDTFVALVYLHKHFDAIVASVVKGEIQDVETIDSRFHDARNYIDILYALVKNKANSVGADQRVMCAAPTMLGYSDEMEKSLRRFGSFEDQFRGYVKDL